MERDMLEGIVRLLNGWPVQVGIALVLLAMAVNAVQSRRRPALVAIVALPGLAILGFCAAHEYWHLTGAPAWILGIALYVGFTCLVLVSEAWRGRLLFGCVGLLVVGYLALRTSPDPIAPISNFGIGAGITGLVLLPYVAIRERAYVKSGEQAPF